MTSPSELQTDAAAETSALTVSIIKDQALGSFLTMGRMVGPIVAVAVVVVLFGAVLYFLRRAAAEARAGRQTLDPRPLVDPNASDVLGVW